MRELPAEVLKWAREMREVFGEVRLGLRKQAGLIWMGGSNVKGSGK